MGIFDRISNKVTTENRIVWNSLTELNQLDDIVRESQEKPVLIFKHSTRCGISRMALRGFEVDYDFQENELKPYYLDLLHFRDVSNAVAEKFGVYHQSPQILVIKNGVSVFETSHGDINASTLRNKI